MWTHQELERQTPIRCFLFPKARLTALETRPAETSMECAGGAQRRRRFGVGRAFRSRNQSGVALRSPPHSIRSPVVARCVESLQDCEIVHWDHEPARLGARTALSARNHGKQLADMAVRAPRHKFTGSFWSGLILLASALHLPCASLRAQTEWIEKLDQSLSVQSGNGWFRSDLSGLIDLELYYIDQKPPGLVFSDAPLSSARVSRSSWTRNSARISTRLSRRVTIAGSIRVRARTAIFGWMNISCATRPSRIHG